MRYNFLIVYGLKNVFYNLPNGTDRKLVVSNRISLGIMDMTAVGMPVYVVMMKQERAVKQCHVILIQRVATIFSDFEYKLARCLLHWNTPGNLSDVRD